MRLTWHLLKIVLSLKVNLCLSFKLAAVTAMPRLEHP